MKLHRPSIVIKFSDYIIYFIIVFFTVIIVPLCNEKWQYIPMLGMMYASPFLLLGKLRYFNLSDIIPALFVAALFVSCLYNTSSFRVSSLLYTCMFVSTFFLFEKCMLRTRLGIDQIMHLLKIILLLYCIVLIIQQISFLLNIPIINEAYGGENERSLKMNSLSIEPSNTGPIVTILVFVYTKLFEIKINKKIKLKQFFIHERRMMLGYIYICVGSLSVSCLFSLFVFLLYFIDFKHFFSRNISIILISILVSTIVIKVIPELNDRVSNLISAIFTLDPRIIYEVDSSSSARLAPPLIYLSEFSIFNPHIWLGYGMGYGGTHSISLLSGSDTDEFTGMGGIILLFFDFGLIPGVLFMYYIYKICNGLTYSFAFFLLLIFLQFSLNHYVLWLFVFGMIIINHYSNVSYPASNNVE